MPASPVPRCVRVLAREPPQPARHQKIPTHTPVPERSVRPLAERVTNRLLEGARDLIHRWYDPSGWGSANGRHGGIRASSPAVRSDLPTVHGTTQQLVPSEVPGRFRPARIPLPAARIGSYC